MPRAGLCRILLGVWRSCDYSTLFSGAERYFARGDLSAWWTALLLLKVSFHHARCAGRQGREANGEIAGCTQSTKHMQ